MARGTQTREGSRRSTDACPTLPLDGIYVCYHDDADGCDCRKPKPGMLLRAAGSTGSTWPRSFMVGDRWGDVEAGQAAGCRTFLIDMPYSRGERCRPDGRVADLAEAAEDHPPDRGAERNPADFKMRRTGRDSRI